MKSKDEGTIEKKRIKAEERKIIRERSEKRKKRKKEREMESLKAKIAIEQAEDLTDEQLRVNPFGRENTGLEQINIWKMEYDLNLALISEFGIINASPIIIFKEAKKLLTCKESQKLMPECERLAEIAYSSVNDNDREKLMDVVNAAIKAQVWTDKRSEIKIEKEKEERKRKNREKYNKWRREKRKQRRIEKLIEQEKAKQKQSK